MSVRAATGSWALLVWAALAVTATSIVSCGTSRAPGASSGVGVGGGPTPSVVSSASRDASAPTAAPASPVFVDVQATGDKTCATGVDGYAYAWGRAIGERPVRVAGLRAVRRVGCAGGSVCALDKYGAITCAGHRLERENQDAPREEKITGLPPASDFVLTAEGGCAIASGDLWCWRRSRFTEEDFPIVEPVEGVHDVVRMHTDFLSRTCVTRRAGPPLCVSAFPEPRPEKIARKGAGDAGPAPLARAVRELTTFDGARDVLPIERPHGICAVRGDGTMTCDGEITATALAKVVGEARAEGFFEAGAGHACVRLESGDARCIELDPNAPPSTLDATARTLAAPALISFGTAHACAIAGADLSCWGRASDGQLGDGTAYDHARAVKVPGITSAAHLSVGHELTCVTLASGGLSCWGGWDDEQSARPRPAELAPVRVEVPAPASDVFVGSRLGDVLCAKLGAGFSCVTSNIWLPLAVGKAPPRLVRDRALVTADDRPLRFGRDGNHMVVEPHDLDKLGVRVKDLAPDGYCGVTPIGDIVCAHCGGCEAYEAKRALTRIHGAHKFVQVASLLWRWVGSQNRPDAPPLGTRVCGLTDGGAVECYRGDDIPWVRMDHPARVDDKLFASLTDVVQIAGDSGQDGRNLFCALDKRGAVTCAGDNSHGQLGIGSKEKPTSLAPVLDLPAAVEIGVARDHACARTAGGDVYCWGNNARGGAPDGAPVERESPVRVVL